MSTQAGPQLDTLKGYLLTIQGEALTGAAGALRQQPEGLTLLAGSPIIRMVHLEERHQRNRENLEHLVWHLQEKGNRPPKQI